MDFHDVNHELIAKFYLDAVKSLEGIPLQIKADNGT